MSQPRVVITGMGQISPLGIGNDDLWTSLSECKTKIGPFNRIPKNVLPTRIGGEASKFNGGIDDFGPLEKGQKRSIKKGLKLMCRDIEMGVAAAQWALADAGLTLGNYDPERIGCLFGCDYIMTMPQEFEDAIFECREDGKLQFDRWGKEGLPKVEPLWLLKYLPNMPASHVAIYNDLRGPSNSLTVREASSNMAVAEAYTTLRRGSVDMIICGATGSRIHPLRSTHTSLQEALAEDNGDVPAACRPFDKNRNGMVIGEGAGAIVLETEQSANNRGATIVAEVLSFSSSTVAHKDGTPDFETAFFNVIDGALKLGGLQLSDIGHIHAHGNSSVESDLGEAKAIGGRLGANKTPVTAAKSYMGNLGAGSGLVELISSVHAMQHDWLFPILNCDNLDPACPIRVAQAGDQPGNSFINLNTTPQGQASAVIIGAWQK